MRRLNGTPKEVLEEPEIMQLVLPMLRADFQLVQTYLYRDEPPLNCPITAFGGLGDEDIPREDLQEWASQTVASFTLRMMPGDHFFIHSSRSVLTDLISVSLTGILRETI